MNKQETKNLIKKIFNYIDCGEVATEYNIFKGHPGLYFFHQEEELERQLDLYLEKEEYNRYDVYYIVQKSIKFLLNQYDSHTRMWFQDNITFPIKFKFENNDIYVIHITDDLDNVVGGKLISINGISIKKIVKELEQIICYSTNEYLQEMIVSYITQINILKSLPSIDTDIDKVNYQIEHNGTINEIIFYEKEGYSDCIDNKPDNCSYEIIDNIVVIHYSSCRNRQKMNELVENLKKEILNKGIQRYIVDIRDNHGGDSSIIDPLIDFLTDKHTVALVNEKVFSSGMMAMMELKRIGSYIIGTNIGTSLNYFGETPDKLDLNDLKLSIKRSNRYWYYDQDLNCRSFTKGKFEEYFKDKKELLKPIFFIPDEYVSLTVNDITSNNDKQLNRAINYIKHMMGDEKKWKLK